MMISSCAPRSPIGITSRPPGASCSVSGAGTAGAAAVTITPWKGARSGQPPAPSPSRVSMVRRSSRRNRSSAATRRSGSRSTVATRAPRCARIAVWYPDPVPISSTRPPRRGASAAVMSATINGWEIVWPLPIGSGASSYASAARWGGRNHSRGTHAIAASTRRSRIPRLASWLATMRRRARRVSGAGPPTCRPPRLPSHRVNYSLTRSIARLGPLPEPTHPRILVVGDAAARPDGLERFLVRGGFQVTEVAYPPPAPTRPAQPAPDLVIFGIGATDAGLAEAVRDLATATPFAGAPVIVLVADGGAGAVADALQAGAQDAMASPVHFGELRARIDAHLQPRRELQHARDALPTRDLLFDIFQEVSAALRAAEIFRTLVRRGGQAFGLTHCSFGLSAPGEDKGRVVAVYENPAIRDLRVELERYPEIQEAIRTERPVIIHDVREHPLFETIRKRWVQQQLEVNVQAAVALPVFVQGRAAGVFFLRTIQGDPPLRTQDVAFANTIAH